MKTIYFLILSGLVLSSCNPGGGGSNGAPARPQYEGDLAAKAQEIYGTAYESHFYDCDRKWKDRILELASAVEANRAHILEIQKNSTEQDADEKLIKFNGFEFLESLTEPKGVDKWTESRYSWPKIYSYYVKVKNEPKHPAWLVINGASRSLILEDIRRISYQLHPGARLSAKEVILSTYAKIELCQKNSACISIDFSPVEKTWLQESVEETNILNRLSSGVDYATKRNDINTLNEIIGYAADRFGFFKNATLRTEGNTLIVPLNVSVLGADASKLIAVLEKTWAVHGLELKIVNSGEGYRVDISNTPGERAYVNHNDKQMQLFAPAPLATVEHEFGHILGLRDSYYTSFDQKTCDYVDDSNEGNIMSSHLTGHVLKEHIEKIKSAYGLN